MFGGKLIVILSGPGRVGLFGVAVSKACREREDFQRAKAINQLELANATPCVIGLWAPCRSAVSANLAI